MLNAIDVNQFLIDKVDDGATIPGLLKYNLNFFGQGSNKLLAQKMVNQYFGAYCIALTKDSFGFFDSNDTQSFLFHYDIMTHQLFMNHRRAQSKDIKFFIYRLFVVSFLSYN